jgi:ketosteroid isomerase-like protein
MFTGPLEHRIAIRELHETYGAGVLAKDPVLWGSVWAEDARWSLLGHEVAGRAAIVAFWSAAMDACDAVSFVSVPASIELDGDTGSGITQTHEILRTSDGTTRVLGGAYDDSFVRCNGRWLYAARSFRVVAEYEGARP